MVGCGNRLFLVMCLVLFERALARVLEDIPKTEGSPRLAIHLDNTNREISEGLFEGDIVLTPEQKLLLQQRKATQWARFWPKDSSGTVTVGYRFGDNNIDRKKLMVAITQWEQNTCIRFKKVKSTVGYAHLIFVDSMGCSSYVGRIPSLTTGQRVWLHPFCVIEVGPAVHEIGHALGFYHEQSRSDRDDYVKIILTNVQAGYESNFRKETTYNYEVPYDYYSVMHYGPTYFTSNKNDTITSSNPLAQPLIGNRVGLSFADKLLANAMYGCLDQWLTKCSLTSDPCQHLGYTGANCSCVCPAGTSGEKCQVLQDSYTDALIKLMTPYSAIITTEGIVSTPGYPTPIQIRTTFVKVLVAPACHNVKLTVTDFQVFDRNTDDSTCTLGALTIRTSDTLGSGAKYCGTEIANGTVFISGNNTIVLDYFNFDYSSVIFTSPFRGFNATIEHIPVTGCFISTTTPPPSTGPLNVTVVNSGSIPLTELSSSNGSCSLGYNSRYHELMNGRYPNPYFSREECNLNTESSEPRYLSVAATEVKIGGRDAIVIKSLFDAEKIITSAQVGNSYVFPSTVLNFHLKSSTWWWFGRRYKLTITVLNSDCHQIVRVQPGAPGTLTKSNYPANTVCEWWIQAPSGKQIKLDFSAFKVGQFDCSSDYLAIDTSGDKRYENASQQYCGRNTPGSVTSTGEQLNVILNGFQGGSPGFTATYTVV